jgi:anti-sigma regulatory factor (Ser/Thr protein kinase)
MFGFPRLKEAVATYPGGARLIDLVRADLRTHTGPDAEQEDDITMVTLARDAAPDFADDGPFEQLVEFDVASVEGNERQASRQVTDVVGRLGLDPARLERLETAVGEATMNAMEHGNHYRADRPVTVRVLTRPGEVRVRIVDHGGAPSDLETEVPDLEAKLAGLQRARGWGLFLIKEMVDEAHELSDGKLHTLELVVRLDDPHDRADDRPRGGSRDDA